MVAPEVPDSPDFPGLSMEVRGTRGQFASHQVLEGSRATGRAVLDGLSRSSVVHFACNAKADPRRPLDGSVVLAGGHLLTLEDCRRQVVSGLRLVVLSSCETIGAGQDPVAATLSLPLALSGLGVPGVVGSLWGVPDIGATVLVTRFYQLWRDEGREPAEALRRAQQWVRDTTEEEQRAAFPDITWPWPPQPPSRHQSHPAVWAAYTYAGV